MKNTITRPPKLPPLPDTPLLDYAKGFRNAGRLKPKSPEEQNGPDGAVRTGMADGQAKRLWAEEQDRLLDEQIARAWEEEDLWSSRPRGKPERKPPAPVPLPPPVRGGPAGTAESGDYLDRLIDEAWFDPDEDGLPVPPDWKKMLARPENTGYDGLNGSLPPRANKTDGKTGPQNMFLTPEEAENALIVPLPDYDLSKSERVLFLSSAAGNGQPTSDQKEVAETQSSSGGGYRTLDGRRVGTMAEKIEADARYRMAFKGESADSVIASLAENVSTGKITAAEAAEIAEETGHTPVTVYLPNGKIVTADATNGVTKMPDGSRPPEGAVVHTAGGDYQMQNGSGIKVTTVPITTADGTDTIGTVSNGKTYTLIGDRISEGTVVHTADGDYQMVNGVGVKESTTDAGGTANRTILDVKWETQFIPYKDSYKPNVRSKSNPSIVAALCAIAAESMVANYYSPGCTSTAALYEAHLANGGNRDADFGNLSRYSGLNLSKYDSGTINEPTVLAKVRNAIDEGKPAIVRIAYSGGTHFVVVYGYTESGTSRNDFLIRDPASSSHSTLEDFTGSTYYSGAEMNRVIIYTNHQ